MPIKMRTETTNSKQSQESLAVQYGGNNRSNWFLKSLFLIYFPHIFGALHAAIISDLLVEDLAYASTLTFAANALVERTRCRPIPRGAVLPSAALIFTATQAISAALFLPFFPRIEILEASLYAVPGIIGWSYYPYAKRHTYFPQVVLGLCLSWGVVMGSLAGGFAPVSISTKFSDGDYFSIRIDPSTFCLFAAGALWTVMYDTIYAHQDVEDDKEAGIKSLAVLFEGRQLLAVKAALLVACGCLSEMGAGYYAVTVLGSTASLGVMVWKVDLESSQSCWWWFGNGFWLAGGSIVGGWLWNILCSSCEIG
ncbi:UbiA prenyltransferase family-domain-containing protein [Aspergillus californicus]